MATRSGLSFLNAELHTGLALSRVATTARSPEKKQRNLTNARKAYDSILHYLPGSHLTPAEASDFDLRLDELREVLKSLGEAI
jgi:hypothetical protein